MSDIRVPDWTATTPAAFVSAFFRSLTERVLAAESDEEIGPLVDQYYTPDLLQIKNGDEYDRDNIAARMSPLRSALLSCRYEVHDALAQDSRIATRFTVHADLRNSGPQSTEVQMIAEFAPDGRMRRAHKLTRTITPRLP